MVDEASKEEMDMITKAHLAAERLEKAVEANKEVVKRMEAFEARQILGGKANASEPTKRELTEDEKLDVDTKNYFKGGMVERYL